jgi:flagellar basal-body rod modification protein FlgD
MVTGVGQSGSAALGSELGGANKALDKSAFLKLLVAQLQHQDPLKPQDDTAFVAQLAQFSSLEQTMGINDRLDLLSAQNAGLQNSQIVSLIGEVATVRGNVATLGAGGSPVSINYTVDAPAAKTTVSITDSSGNVIRTLEAKATKGGLQKIVWDGHNDAGMLQPAGRYGVTVRARGAADEVVGVTQETSGTVKSVSFAKGYPELSLDNGLAVPVADLLRVETSKTP